MASKSLHDHLVEIRNEAAKSNNSKIQAKVLFANEIGHHSDVSSMMADFMIWGDEFLVTSQLNTLNVLFGLDCNARPADVTRANERFSALFEMAQPIDAVI